MRSFEGLSASQQRKRWEERATDTRPRVSSGFVQLDELLNRGGFSPGEVVVMGGRTHTRKSTVMLNMVERLLRMSLPVGLVGLDEPTPSYVAKLASVFTRKPHAYLEEHWGTEEVQEWLDTGYWPYVEKLSLTSGSRPGFEDLTAWLATCEVDVGERPRVVFIDYVSLLERNKYHGQDANRIPRVFEDLQVWAADEDISVVALHQVSRGGHHREHLPMRLEHLKYGGEEFADVVLATFRPALELLGNLSREQAELEMREDFDEEEYGNAVQRVRRYENSTFLQLLKNRPGTELSESGIELLSPTKSIYLEPAA